MTKFFRRAFSTVLVAFMLLTVMSTGTFAAQDATLYQKAEEHKAALLTDLESFVNIDTGSGQEPGLLKFQGMLIERFKELGAEVEYTPVNKPQAGYNIK